MPINLYKQVQVPPEAALHFLLGKRGVVFRLSCLALPCFNDRIYMYKLIFVGAKPLGLSVNASSPQNPLLRLPAETMLGHSSLVSYSTPLGEI